MNIIVEGMDATGKSTLVKKLAKDMGLKTMISGGPPKSVNEINSRVINFMGFHSHVFDRHPVVSQRIYDIPRKEKFPIRPELEERFYELKPIIVYCDPPSHRQNLDDHVVKETDDEQHLDMVGSNYALLLANYRMWAFERAHIIYRIGDDMDQIVNMVWGEYTCRKL